MQTFVPLTNLEDNAEHLDGVRLRNQRRESLSILTTLHTGKGWIHHPVTKMWRGHELALITYTIAICEECVQRGGRDTTMDRLMNECYGWFRSSSDKMPFWWGDPRVHDSHKAALIFKDPAYYGPFWPDITVNTDDLTSIYYWPVR